MRTDDGDNHQLRVPIKELIPELNKIEDYYCDGAKDTVILSISGQNSETGAEAAKKIVVINSEFIDKPNRRIHSILEYEGKINKLMSSGYSEEDEIIILAYSKSPSQMESYYATLDGPHFFFDTSQFKEEGKLSLKVKVNTQPGTEPVPSLQVLGANLEHPVLSGSVTIKSGKSLPEISLVDTNFKGKIDMCEIFDFKGPVIDLRYDSSAGKPESQASNTID